MPNVATQQTIDFLSWLVGSSDTTYIHIWGKRESSKPGQKPPQAYLFYNDPEQIAAGTWEDKVQTRFNLYFCTSRTNAAPRAPDTGKFTTGKNAEFAATIASIWFDIDAFKSLVDPRTGDPIVTGAEFYQDLREVEDGVSAWVRSSEHGIQGHYKLKTPFDVQGDKARFDERIAPLLSKIAWYYGGDFQVVQISAMARLPGTTRTKPGYKPWPVTCQTYPDRPLHTVKGLYERFDKVDFSAVPRAVAYALVKLVRESGIWAEGGRNSVAMAMAGSIRKAGLDRESCRRAVREIAKAMVDDSDRKSEVDSTYDRSPDEPVQSLYGVDKDVAPAVEAVLALWVFLKSKYAEKIGHDWKPEAFEDPTQAVQKSDLNRAFYVRDGETYCTNKDGDPTLAANFTIAVTRRVVKLDGSETAIATLAKVGSPSIEIEMTASLQSSWQRFVTTSPMVAGVAYLAPPGTWPQYTFEVDRHGLDVPRVRETPYYGILGAGADRTLFLPGQESNEWVWPHAMAQYDTADEGALTREASSQEKADYLRGLARHLPRYHDASYWVPTLGWFCACPLTTILREDPRYGKGFPTLLVTGQKGSGKSTLAGQILGQHFGCKTARSAATMPKTLFALVRSLGASNVCPYVLDEFRNTDPVKTDNIGGVIRSLWDGHMAREGGDGQGGVRTDHLASPLCVVGESAYTDPATLDRTLSVHVSSAWINDKPDWDPVRRADHEESTAWLQDDARRGMLGTMLLEHLSANLGAMDDLVSEAVRTIEANCPTTNERKRKGFVAAYAGLLLLRRLYAEHGIPVPAAFKDRAAFAGLYEADREVGVESDEIDPTLRQLFRITDHAIVEASRRHQPYKDDVLRFTPTATGDRIVHFQASRWFEIVIAGVKASTAASLQTERGFEDLLMENTRGDRPVVVDMAATEWFSHGGVAINATRVGELFKIDVRAWLPESGEE